MFYVLQAGGGHRLDYLAMCVARREPDRRDGGRGAGGLSLGPLLTRLHRYRSMRCACPPWPRWGARWWRAGRVACSPTGWTWSGSSAHHRGHDPGAVVAFVDRAARRGATSLAPGPGSRSLTGLSQPTVFVGVIPWRGGDTSAQRQPRGGRYRSLRRAMRWPLYAGALLLVVCVALWLQSYATALLGIVPLRSSVTRIGFERRFVGGLTERLRALQGLGANRLIPFSRVTHRCECLIRNINP